LCITLSSTRLPPLLLLVLLLLLRWSQRSWCPTLFPTAAAAVYAWQAVAVVLLLLPLLCSQHS
jgi:hypothetical protein